MHFVIGDLSPILFTKHTVLSWQVDSVMAAHMVPWWNWVVVFAFSKISSPQSAQLSPCFSSFKSCIHLRSWNPPPSLQRKKCSRQVTCLRWSFVQTQDWTQSQLRSMDMTETSITEVQLTETSLSDGKELKIRKKWLISSKKFWLWKVQTWSKQTQSLDSQKTMFPSQNQTSR